MDAEILMEYICALDPADRSSGRAGRLVDEGGNKAVSRRYGSYQTAADAAGVVVPGCVGVSVCTDGHRCGADLSGTVFTGAVPEFGTFPLTAGGQFFLEHYFLSTAGVWFVTALAAVPMASDRLHDRCILES